MKRFLRIGDREVEAHIELTEDHTIVTLEDRIYTIDVAAAGQLRSLIIDGNQFETFAQSLGDGRYLVRAGEFDGEVTILDPLEKLAGGKAGSGARGAHKVTAYMPGRVVSLLAAVGDEIESGHGVLVLEAMKMENEIKAETSGVIKSIFVEEGQAVEQGDPLFELE